jgi:SAM-dependent methyltransferase
MVDCATSVHGEFNERACGVQEAAAMAAGDVRKDKHFPLFAHDNLLRRLFGDPHRYCAYVTAGQTVADLGCGPGYYTLALAETVGPEGRVFAVDSDEKAIRHVQEKAARRGYDHVEAHASSAGALRYIADACVDFILANGLLCSMAPCDHESAVCEMKRILKPDGRMYLSVAQGRMSCVDEAEWEDIRVGFEVEQRKAGSFWEDRWAVVSKRSV